MKAIPLIELIITMKQEIGLQVYMNMKLADLATNTDTNAFAL